MRAHGADISKYQIRYQPGIPLDFIIQRVSYGLRVDESFGQLYDDIQCVPVRGAYHYFSSGATWQAQRDHYLELVHDKDYHFHNCDMEKAYNNFNDMFVLGNFRWVIDVIKETKKPCLLYTNTSGYKEAQVMIPPEDLAQLELWIAQYWLNVSPNNNPGMSGLKRDKNDWRFYQYTDRGDGKAYGVKSEAIDLDVYNGTVEDLYKWLGIHEQPPEQERLNPEFLNMLTRLKRRLSWIKG